MRRILSSLTLASAFVLSTNVALADNTEEARTLFNMGAKAYEMGQYNAAIQAFDQAYRAAQRSGILFSIAQAHRRQYFIDKKPEHLRAAIKRYREYLGQAEQGGRKADAAAALAELEPLAAKLAEAEGESGEAPPPTIEVEQRTRLMVSSPVQAATIIVDNGKPAEAPLIAEIKPGKHTLSVKAEGYFEEKRDIQVSPGGVTALDIPLREQPAHLSIETNGKAQISVDGRMMGMTPLSRAIDLPAGTHLITITKNGFDGYSEEIELNRGEKKSISTTLSMSTQRKAAYAAFGVGLVAGGLGVVTGLLSAGAEKQALDIQNRIDAGQIDCRGDDKCQDITDYNNSLKARDTLRTATGALIGGAVVAGATGLVLYLFDQPKVRTPSPRKEKAPSPATPSPDKEKSLELSASPVIIPGFYGGSFSARF